jgi:methionyl aminopeptidase
VLRFVEGKLQPGIRTSQIDAWIHDMIVEYRAYPSPLGYKGFPRSVCTSVNNVLCHGIPDERPLRSGDIINIDVSVFLDGVHGDASKTFCIGDVDRAGHHLVHDLGARQVFGQRTTHGLCAGGSSTDF